MTPILYLCWLAYGAMMFACGVVATLVYNRREREKLPGHGSYRSEP